jgi:hypothetical protein
MKKDAEELQALIRQMEARPGKTLDIWKKFSVKAASGWIGSGNPDPPKSVTAVVNLYQVIAAGKRSSGRDTGKNGWVHYRDEKVLGKSAELRYRLVGVLSGKIRVLEVLDISGGPGSFGWLLFAKIEEDLVPSGTGTSRKRVILKSLGTLGLGDRNHPSVKVTRNQVVVGPSEGYPKGRIVSATADGEITVDSL